MIVGTSITVEIGNNALLSDASFVVGTGEKVGLVGKNGSGKSSLISVLVNEASSHLRFRGNVAIRGTFGFLPQAPVPGGLGMEATGFSHILSARGIDVLDAAMDSARQNLEKDPSVENVALFSDLEEEYRVNGGYEVESTISRLAAGLGLREEALLDDIDSLSGGQRRRVDLIRVLFQEPETLILDEPTNHLDLAAKKWLMDELEKFKGAILLISHDLKLLDTSIDKVLHLRGGKLHEYKGSYSSFMVQVEADIDQREKEALLQGKEIKRLSTLADSMRGSTNRRARIAKSLDHRVERLEGKRVETLKRDKKRVFKLPVPERSGVLPIEVSDLSVTYGDLKVLKNISMAIERGDRVVVIGRNGAGKTSLLRCLAGVQNPTGGSIRYGAHVSVGYFAQEHEQLDYSRNVLDNVNDKILKTETERRALLGSFGITGSMAYQMPETLSGGERAKLGLAMLGAGEANLLLLDEPTNNLDPASIEAVGLMLNRWSGTVVVVSHDRAFVEALEPTHCLSLPGETYTYWQDDYLDEVELRR